MLYLFVCIAFNITFGIKNNFFACWLYRVERLVST